ncbi:hypothetical protein C8F04DRAFT_370422 [Mycena alexandri]|uniref:Uncharacterized protein n=1 Tax=Mycena alexandri TaxID=1745969 RepID=A0AAD6XAI1_9AGAR|nr:hypothetical protein C8F04DRAFT_370422 [Mycena alexandri]
MARAISPKPQTEYTSHAISCHDLPFQSIVTYGFIVDGHLHRLRLRNTLEKLIVERWNILGARIGKDAQGRFEYRVPSVFNDEIEAFTFDNDALATPLADHFQIPAPTLEPSMFTPSASTIFQPPGHLRHDHVSRYESLGQPILHLQIVQFSDEKTSVGLTVPACFCDSWGMKELLSAWSSVLAKGGNTEDVPALIEDTMILENIAPEVVSDGTPGSLSIHRAPSEPLTDSRNESCARGLFMPAEVLVKMTEECRTELTAEADEVGVDEEDVLLAWLVKRLYSTDLPDRPLAVSIPVNLRDKLPALANRVYLHNAIHMTTRLFQSLHASSLCKKLLAHWRIKHGPTLPQTIWARAFHRTPNVSC